MLERDMAMSLIETALRHSTADQTEVMLHDDDEGLTRLANGGVHQNVRTQNTHAQVRAVIGTRVGVAASNRVTAEGMMALVDRAIAIARVTEPNPEFVSLPAPQTITPAPLLGLPDLSPEHRAQAARQLVVTAEGNGVTAAGRISTRASALAVGNSLGVRAYHAWSQGSVMSIMTRGDASGYAAWDGADLAQAPVEAIAARAAGKCLACADPCTVAPGAYTVILEPPAVAEMLSMLAMIALGAMPFGEGRSALSGKLGEPLVGANITLRDDAYHPQTIQVPFDFEGVPKRVVPFFEHGVARAVAYDSYTAQKDGSINTGHALPAPNAAGPLPWNLVLEGGDTPQARLLDGVERGILVTRFHYVNIVHPKETILTGMTRDGTFLIENGSARPVKNLRFTQSILDALRHVTALEDTIHLVDQEGIFCLVPTLRIEGFNFTS